MWRVEGIDGLELKHAEFSTFRFGRHLHASHVISLPSPSIHFKVSGQYYQMESDQIILLNPGEVHEMGSPHHFSWSFRCFYLDSTLMRAVADSCSPAVPLPRFSRSIVRDSHIRQVLLYLHQRLDRNRFDSNLKRDFLNQMRPLIKTHCVGEVDKTGHAVEKPASCLDQVRIFLEDHYSENICLEKLSDIAGISPFHLLRCFKEKFGLPPNEFQNAIRIQRARSFLNRGDAIIDVAMKTGFSDQSHLTRVYKKYIGLTPGQYRNSN